MTCRERVNITPTRANFCCNPNCRYHRPIVDYRDTYYLAIPDVPSFLESIDQNSIHILPKKISNNNVIELFSGNLRRIFRFCDQCGKLCTDLNRSWKNVQDHIIQNHVYGCERCDDVTLITIMNRAISLWYREQSFKKPGKWINNLGQPVKFLDAGISQAYFSRPQGRFLLANTNDCVTPHMLE